MRREHFPNDVEKIFDEIRSVSKGMKDRREFQHILLCVELQDMAIERDVYRQIAIEYCAALNKDLGVSASRAKMVDNEAKRMYESAKVEIAVAINESIGEGEPTK